MAHRRSDQKNGGLQVIDYTPPAAATSIPLIDLADSGSDEIEKRRAVAVEIHKACRDTGFFYVANHGVPLAMMEAQLDSARRFFSMPAEQKREVASTSASGILGYEGLHTQTLDPGSPADLKESFMTEIEPKAPPPDHHSRNLWPSDLPGFKQQALAYSEQIVGLGRRIASSLALSLDLPEAYFEEALEKPACSVRLLRYPPHPENAAPNQLGSGAHTDWGLITILLQDDRGGLEVRNADGVWIRANPIPGAFVINLGDMIPRLTNELYHSNMHRVLNNVSGMDRYSVASFFNPPEDYLVKCVPTCMPKEGEPKYPPCTVGEHTQEMIIKTYGKAA
jgi:isopenicillin N synthase-like dioxygenase